MSGQINLFDCHPLFEDVQLSDVLDDNKTFVDCSPKESLDHILQQYLEQKDLPHFNLKEFILAHFDLPHETASDFDGRRISCQCRMTAGRALPPCRVGPQRYAGPATFRAFTHQPAVRMASSRESRGAGSTGFPPGRPEADSGHRAGPAPLPEPPQPC